jgi:hypothetical protein
MRWRVRFYGAIAGLASVVAVGSGHADGVEQQICTADEPAVVRLDREPVFKPIQTSKEGASAEEEKQLGELAMRAVYDRCSKYAVFREGSTLDASSTRYPRPHVNVTVKLADPAQARGNTLWYRVYFKAKKPFSFSATKTIAAELCGLPDKDVEVPL